MKDRKLPGIMPGSFYIRGGFEMETRKFTGRVREHTWDCPHCGRKNRGRDRECAGCGRPRSTETKFNTNETIAVLDGEDAKRMNRRKEL